VLAFAQGLSAHRAGHPLFPTVCRQDETSSRRLGKHVLEIQGQRIDLIVVTGYGESNELVAEVDRPRLIVENVDPSVDKKMEVFLETLLLVAAAEGPELGSQSLCGQHPMQSRARRGIFDQYLLDAIPLKESLSGVAHFYLIEARSEHVQEDSSVFLTAVSTAMNILVAPGGQASIGIRYSGLISSPWVDVGFCCHCVANIASP
jgi:hypothetical protein